jgi:hypothetical protein
MATSSPHIAPSAPLQSVLWTDDEHSTPLAALADRLRARICSAKTFDDLPWADEGDKEMALFLASMPCPPQDRLRTVTVPDVFHVEEAAFERWRYQMRSLVRALSSDTMQNASKVRVPVRCSAARCTMLVFPPLTCCVQFRHLHAQPHWSTAY